jgi:UPF0755 protein
LPDNPETEPVPPAGQSGDVDGHAAGGPAAPGPGRVPRRRNSGRKVLIALGLIVALCGAAAGGGAFWLVQAVERPGPLPAGRDVVVAPGSATQVAADLRDAGVIDSPFPFRLVAWLTRGVGPLHAAELSFPAHASLRQVLAVLRFGKPVRHLVTIAEGLTAKQIAAVLDKAEAATGTVEPPAEGSVLPESYAYEYGTPRATILARAQAAMARELAAAWKDRAASVKLSPAETLILASIVERETAKPEERSHVAAVYLNRLRLGMRLQADPTVVYGASDGLGVLDHKLTRAELEQDDPYNTYRNAGLPPGPICSPGEASLRAVTHPADSEDLYFVADGSGGHNFSRTREAHERNVARWRAAMGARSGVN